jgi:hypothetical protein
MKSLLTVGFTLCAFLFCGHAHAQFSQPPPSTQPPPVCSLSKTGDGGTASRCKVDPLPWFVTLECLPSNGSVSCVSYHEAYNGVQWVRYGSSQLHYWAFIANGQEYYMPPNYSDMFSFICGRDLYGYVRVTVEGVTATVPYQCPRSNGDFSGIRSPDF